MRSISIAQFRFALNWLGVVILLAGLGSAAVVWRAQVRLEQEDQAAHAANPNTPLAPLDSRKQTREVELYYGKVGVLVEEAGELLHGKPLAGTMATLSAITAVGLFLAAARLRE